MGFDPNAAASENLTSANAAGFFSPMGSPAVLAATKRSALQHADNYKRRSQILGQLAGLDPYGQQQNIVDTNREAAGGVQGALDQSQLSQLLGNQQFARGLFTNRLQNQDLLRRLHEMHQQGQHDQFMGLLGTLGGAAAGSLFGMPGLGAGLGHAAIHGSSNPAAGADQPMAEPSYDWPTGP